MANILEQSDIKPFQGLKIEIIKHNAKWYVNGKSDADASYQEKAFLDAFFRETKLDLKTANDGN